MIQWKYSRASTLPPQAPAEFKLADRSGNPDKLEDQAARAAYWAKLREEWLQPENWHTSYGVDLSWPVRNAMIFIAGDQAIHRLTRHRAGGNKLAARRQTIHKSVGFGS